jgi:predicted DsbA family dithiol-disulfide isomerase
MNPITVDVWSDLVCPWCYIGKRRFDRALADFPHRDAVRVRWRSFELEPGAPREPGVPVSQRIQRDLGVSRDRAERIRDDVTALAADVGLTYRLDLARPANSFDAHRLLHRADELGVGEPVRERLMSAYTGEGAVVSDHATLTALAAEAGMDPAEARALLDGDAHADTVRSDERRARSLGVTGVPTFVFGGVRGVAGAQPIELFTELLHDAWAGAAGDRVGDADGGFADDGGCDGGSCPAPGPA